jgi:hypothetical protein
LEVVIIFTKKKVKKTSRSYWRKLLRGLEKDKCSICGYNKCFAAIEYHHVKGIKKYNVSKLMNTLPTREGIEELDKCIAVCSNCHRELHYG